MTFQTFEHGVTTVRVKDIYQRAAIYGEISLHYTAIREIGKKLSIDFVGGNFLSILLPESVPLSNAVRTAEARTDFS